MQVFFKLMAKIDKGKHYKSDGSTDNARVFLIYIIYINYMYVGFSR